MGMAASQARFLCLTARKSNTEYQGQQVNQQRTLLANESAGLYNRMLAMDVPTPPNSSDYYTKTYQFAESATGEGTKYKFTTTPRLVGDNMYKIGISWDVEAIQMTLAKRAASVTKKEDGSYDKIKFDGNDYELALFQYSEEDGYDISNREVISTDPDTGEVTYKDLGDAKRTTVNISDLQKLYGTDETEFYSFGSDKTDGIRYYIPASKLEDIFNNTDPNAKFSAYYPKYIQSQDYGYVKGKLVKSDSGRYDKLEIFESDREDLNPDAGNSLTLQLVVTDVRDDEGYEQAMNDYEYKKAQYDKEIQDINAKTDLIQRKDKSLELKLKQLDTEQEALKNELEAVQEVINKNVESTFKTFSA